jgi:hypothetical protein
MAVMFALLTALKPPDNSQNVSQNVSQHRQQAACEREMDGCRIWQTATAIELSQRKHTIICQTHHHCRKAKCPR